MISPHSSFIIKGSQETETQTGQELQEGADAEAMEECYLLA